MTPTPITSNSDLLNELIALQSALNMRVFENTIMTQDTLISDTYWGSHANEHLLNIITYIQSQSGSSNT